MVYIPTSLAYRDLYDLTPFNVKSYIYIYMYMYLMTYIFKKTEIVYKINLSLLEQKKNQKIYIHNT